jgi:hypothetical protein
LESKSDLPICLFDGYELVGRDTIGEDAEPLDARQHLLQQPKSLFEQLQMLEYEPSYIPSWASHAVDIP